MKYFLLLSLLGFTHSAFAQEISLSGESAQAVYESMTSLKAKEFKEEPNSSTWVKTSKNIQCSKSTYGVPTPKTEYACTFNVSKNGTLKSVPFKQ